MTCIWCQPHVSSLPELDLWNSLSRHHTSEQLGEPRPATSHSGFNIVLKSSTPEHAPLLCVLGLGSVDLRRVALALGQLTIIGFHEQQVSRPSQNRTCTWPLVSSPEVYVFLWAQQNRRACQCLVWVRLVTDTDCSESPLRNHRKTYRGE